jgi:hypothetical protein
MPVDNMPQGGGVKGFLSKKVGPFPTWAYLVVAGGGVAYYWYRQRSDSGAQGDSAVTPDASADSTGTPESTDYGTGYDYGYAAGLNATGQDTSNPDDSSTDTAPSRHAGKICYEATNPAGGTQKVCDVGHWVQKKNGGFKWESGPKKNSKPVRRDPPRKIKAHKNHGSSAKLHATGQTVNYATV